MKFFKSKKKSEGGNNFSAPVSNTTPITSVPSIGSNSFGTSAASNGSKSSSTATVKSRSRTRPKTVGNSIGSSDSKDSRNTRTKEDKISADEPLNTDKALYDTFEDWLENDSNESFRIKKLNDTGNMKLSLAGLLKSPAQGDIIPHLIKNDSQITWLNITDSKIGANRTLAIIEALKFNKTLKFIGLSYNNIDLDGCLAIQDVLTVNQTLTSIDLKNNNVKDLGFVALMDALKTNNTITDLDLRRNNITGEACHALKDVLLTNTTIQKLELRGNSIGNEGCRTIMEGLDNNTTLFRLSLDRNNIKPEQVEECNVFVKRNEVIQRHRESIKSEGISYYVTSVCTQKDKMYRLAWAETDSGKIIDEAAKTVGSFALCVFMEQLHIIMNSENSQLPDTSDPKILELMRDRRQLKKLLNQKINSNTYITHTLAASKHSHSLDMLKYLVDKCNASFYTMADNDGFTARAIALASEIEAKHVYANTHGTFLGRYIIDGGKGLKSNPAYKSLTSTVYFAHDVSKMENDPMYQVAIKIMTCEKSFLKVRELSEGESLSILLSGEDIPLSSGRYDANAIVALYRFHDEIDTTGKAYQCLVFQKEGKNLHQIINSELVAGNDEITIQYYGRRIAKCIQHVHSKGHIHGDIKPQNLIRSSKNYMKLIDLDDSVAMGRELTKNFTSAFISPEYARALYGYNCNEEGGKSIQEQITELHKKMIKLDLSKNEDIDTYQVVNEHIQALLSKDACKNKSEEHLLASPSVDIWGFGVIMYYLCIGRPLFLYNLESNFATESEKNRLLMWKGLSRTDLDVPTCYSEHFQELVKTFLMKCLHVHPVERFQSMEEILDHHIFLSIDDI